MNYNDFGKTGENVSSLGFGCMRLPQYQENEEWFIKKQFAGYRKDGGKAISDCIDCGLCEKNVLSS